MVLEINAVCHCFCRSKHTGKIEYLNISEWMESTLFKSSLCFKYLDFHTDRTIYPKALICITYKGLIRVILPYKDCLKSIITSGN